MSESLLTELASLKSAGQDAVFTRLLEGLRVQKDYHKLFDARMLQRKAQLGLPLARPTSLADVPEEHRKSVEETYVDAAREAGQGYLAEGDIPNAWMYFRVIRDKEPVAAVLREQPLPDETTDASEQLIHIALYDGVAPDRGVEMMLRTHGTCSTITALDQALQNMPQEDRRDCAAIMVKSLHADLTESVTREVQKRVPMLPPGTTLRELLTGRDWLFEGGNYHIDCSHLNAVVRFARSCEDSAILGMARDLAEYGSHLSSQLQYPGDAPFEEFFPAHIHFFNALLDEKRDEGLEYFRERLAQEPDEQDKPIYAYVLVDLLVRSGRLDEAVDVAATHLTDIGDEAKHSFVELCFEAKRLDKLEEVMQAKNDPVVLAASLISG